MPVLAHALPVSIGGAPLTLVLTAMLAAYLAVGAMSTRRTSRRVEAGPGAGVAGPGAGGAAGRAGDGAGSAVEADGQPSARPGPGHLVGLAGLVAIAALATFGPVDPSSNLADRVVLAMLWGAVGISSILLGGWWSRVDPMVAISGGLASAVGDPAHDLAHPLPPKVATTALVCGLVAWAWVQLLTVPTVAGFQGLLLAYVVIHIAGTARYGTTWLRQVEPLTVLSSTMGLLRPGGGGPVRRLTAVVDDDRLRWICAVLIGWSLADLLTEIDPWHDLPGSTTRWLGPVVLMVAIGGMYGVIRASTGRFRLGPAFVAVAGGWIVAHYLSLLVLEGQGIPIWLSDPFGTGADLLGRRGTFVDTELVPIGLLAVMQSVPFVAGHLIAVVVVQRRAAAVVSRSSQLGPATFFARAVIGVLLLGGTYLQLGGV